MENRGKFIAAAVLDAVLASSSAFGVIATVCSFYFMVDAGRLTGAPFFVTFTGLSNLLMGIVALVCFLVRLVRKERTLPTWLFLTRMIATAEIAITFLITAGYLAPSVGGDFWRLYINGSLFNHGLTPVLALVSFMVFEPRRELKYPYCLFSLVPMTIYGAFYFIRAYTHVDAAGNIDLYYDIYGLARFGMGATIGFLFAFLGLSLGITSLLYLQNRCKNKANS